MSALEEIHKIYDELPTVNCKGWCWHSCGPIDMSDAERERLIERGVDVPEFTQERSQAWANNEKLYCPALSFSARDGAIGCTAHQDRPLICRVWGVGEDDLACPYGCETSGTLTHAEVTKLLLKTFRLGGHGDDDLAQADATMADLMNDPNYRDLVRRFMAGDASAGPELRARIEARRRN